MLRKEIKYKEAVALLYPDYFDVSSTINRLNLQKILCLSDTTDVLVTNPETSSSIAVHIAKQCTVEDKSKNSKLELIQADLHEFRYNSSKHQFGAHLPQNKHEPRREYQKIDNSNYKTCVQYDVILGKSLLCCCNGPISCGGISANHKKQGDFIQSLLCNGPDLLILSSNLFPDFKNDFYHHKGKEELLKACQEISTMEGNYDIVFMDNFLKEQFKTKVGCKNSGHVLIIFKKENLFLSELPQGAIKFTQKIRTNKINTPEELNSLPKISLFNKNTNNFDISQIPLAKYELPSISNNEREGTQALRKKFG